MPFPSKVKKEALVRSRRCCCICHEFAGLYTNVHHIVPEAEGGPNDLGNAIVLCLRCHGEVGHYNVRHPIGNKYSPEEQRRHRDEWWKWCKKNPAAPLPKDPIPVSPGIINLGKGEWKARSPIKIYNKTDEVYYQIVVKIVIDAPTILTRHIGIDLTEIRSTPELEVDSGAFTVSTDVLRVDGTDEAGNKAIFLWLASLNPRSACTLILTNKSPYIPPASEQPKAFVSVCSFEREPGSVLQSDGKVAISFKPPENITVASITPLMKRTD